MGKLVVRTRQSRMIVSNVEIGLFATRFFPSYTDEASAADAYAPSFGKKRTEAVGVTDSPSVDGGKVFNETPPAIDDQALEFLKAIEDGLSITEGEKRALEKSGITDGTRARDLGAEIDVIKILADVASILDSDAKTLFKALTDGSVASEAHAIAILRYVQDAASASDVQTLNANKILADFGVATDAIDRLDVSKGLSESPGVTDTETLGIGVRPSEEPTAADVFDRTVQFFRDISDGTSVSQRRAFALAQVQGDSVGVSESIAIVSQFFDTLSDVATIDEAEIRLLAKTLTTETTFVSEDETLWIRKFISELAQVTDVPSIELGRSLSDSASVTDVIDVRRGLNRVDVASATDAGSLFNQGYADITYFAEDYVGETRSF